MTKEKPPAPPNAEPLPKPTAPSRADDVVKAFKEALAMPQEEFDRRLAEWEAERDREAQANLKALWEKRKAEAESKKSG